MKKMQNVKKESVRAPKPGFPDEYWTKNYENPEEMDNIVNAKEHARYMKALFELEYIDINSVIDLGFGLGVLFREVVATFKPYRVCGIEPSNHAFEKVKNKKLTSVQSTQVKLLNIDLLTWANKVNDKANDKLKNKIKNEFYDLGLCTSVFQYLSDAEIKAVLPVMAQKIRYLYFSVPTDLEYKRQVADHDFKDEYAIHRSKETYLEFLRPHFSIVGSRLLESRVHFNEETSSFTDLLFRF